MKRKRTVQTAHLSLFTNLAFSLYTGALGITNRSWWFITLAAYYIVLSMMRFAVLLFQRRRAEDDTAELFIARFTGFFFMALVVILGGTTYLAFSGNQGVRHHEIVMISIALYAFLKVTFGIINLVRSRNSSSPILKTLRNISFTDALVSIFSLQRSMLATFQGLGDGDISLFNALTGSVVYLAVFLLGLNLIGGNKINMAKSKLIEANKKIAETVSDGYKKIESGTTGAYRKIEGAVVNSYTKLEDKFIDSFLTREGETVEEARERLKSKQK